MVVLMMARSRHYQSVDLLSAASGFQLAGANKLFVLLVRCCRLEFLDESQNLAQFLSRANQCTSESSQ